MKAFPSDNPEHAALLQEAKAQRERLFPGGAAREPTDREVQAQADPDDEEAAAAAAAGVAPEPTHEADMDEADDAPQTTAQYEAFFQALLAM